MNKPMHHPDTLNAERLPLFEELVGTVNIAIPPAIECRPARANQIGGRYRVHPSWTPWAVGAGQSDAEVQWGAARIHSVDAPMAVTFHQVAGTFAGLSTKMGCVMSGMGPHEHAKWKDLETNPSIAAYLLQGVRATWDDHFYTADYVAHDATLGIVAGEVKADRSYFLDADYGVTMRHADEAFRNADIEFRKETGPQIRGSQTKRRNVDRAFRDRFTGFDQKQEAQVQNRLAKKETALGELEELLRADSRVARTVIHAMLCKRVLAFDLNLPVTPDTLVSVPPAPINYIDIRAIDIPPIDIAEAA